MENQFKNTYGKIMIDDGRRAEMEAVIGRKRNKNAIWISIDYDENKSYSLVENGRLYLVVGDVKIDVTNQCSDTEYYRYEIVNNDGSRNVIFIGGTINNPGWVELIFDASGNYVTNHMCITGYDPQTNPCIWQEQAMHNEGVPCGNWDLDKELYE